MRPGGGLIYSSGIVRLPVIIDLLCQACRIYCTRVVGIRGKIDFCLQDGPFSEEYLFILQDGGIRGSVDFCLGFGGVLIYMAGRSVSGGVLIYFVRIAATRGSIDS